MASLCEQVIDEDAGQVCNKPATHSVTVRNQSGRYIVKVCDEHKAKLNRTYAQMRAESKR